MRRELMKRWILAATVVTASAQMPDGTVAGMVRDPSGASVSRAIIEVVSVATRAARTSTTSEEGNYGIPALVPGEYQVSVQKTGFPRISRTALVEAGSTTTVDFDLRLGDTTESITV